MKSSTYGFFVMLTFLSSLGESHTSITNLIKFTDSIAKEMGCNPNLSDMTKYNVIKELEKNALIVLDKKHRATVSLKNKVEDFVVEWALTIEEDDEE